MGATGRSSSWGAGRPGTSPPFAIGQWPHTIFQELPAIVTTTEELAIHRALILQALQTVDPSAARRISAELGMTLDATDVVYGVGDSARSARGTRVSRTTAAQSWRPSRRLSNELDCRLIWSSSQGSRSDAPRHGEFV